MSKNLKPSLQMEQHPDISAVRISPDGKLLALITKYYTVAVLDAKNGKNVAQFTPSQDMLVPLEFSPDGSTLAFGGWDVAGDVVDTKTWRTRHKLPTPSNALAYSPDGKTLAVGHKKQATLYDLKSLTPGVTLASKVRVDEIVYSPEGKKMIAGNVKELPIFDSASGKPLHMLKHKGGVMSSCFSPDGKLLLCCGAGDCATLWDLKSKKPTYLEHDEVTYDAEFSADGKLIATASGDNVVKIWKAPSGEPVKTLEVGDDGIFYAVFSPDGKRLVSVGSGGEINLWDTTSWTCLGQAKLPLGNSSSAPVWYPDSKRFAVGGYSMLAIYDA
jgi:WD40 repeat protein